MPFSGETTLSITISICHAIRLREERQILTDFAVIKNKPHGIERFQHSTFNSELEFYFFSLDAIILFKEMNTLEARVFSKRDYQLFKLAYEGMYHI